MRLEIADRKKIEQALIESEEQIRTIIQKAPTGIALFDKEGLILECNPALQEMLGYDHNELSGVLFSQAIHPNDVALYKNKFKELLPGKFEGEISNTETFCGPPQMPISRWESGMAPGWNRPKAPRESPSIQGSRLESQSGSAPR